MSQDEANDQKVMTEIENFFSSVDAETIENDLDTIYSMAMQSPEVDTIGVSIMQDLLHTSREVQKFLNKLNLMR